MRIRNSVTRDVRKKEILVSMAPKRLGMSLFLVLLAIPFVARGQRPSQDSVWKPLMFVVGSWTGQAEGEPGKGTYERQYRFIFNNKFIEIRNKSTWAPTATNPKGEVHEDIGYLSYDQGRRTFVLRQFHIEGFVNQYKLDGISPDGRKIVFVSEAIENIGPGWRARETYERIGGDEFSETFELAAPDKEFEVYTRAVLKRTK
jgi:hypothetical protein